MLSTIDRLSHQPCQAAMCFLPTRHRGDTSMPGLEIQVQIRDWNCCDFSVITVLKQSPATWLAVLGYSSTKADKNDCSYPKRKPFLSMCSLREGGACQVVWERESSHPVRNPYGTYTFTAPQQQEDFALLSSPSHSDLGSAVWLGAVYYMSLRQWFTNSLKSPAKPAGAQLFILLSCCFLFSGGSIFKCLEK